MGTAGAHLYNWDLSSKPAADAVCGLGF